MSEQTAAETSVRVGVYWPALASRPDQLQRIEDAAGAPLVIWKEGEAAPPEMSEVTVIVAGRLPDDVLETAPRLKMVQSPAAGAEWLATHPLGKTDVVVATAAGVHGVQIGEHALMLLLALNRSLPDYVLAQRRHRWLHNAVSDDGHDIAPRELYGMTLLLIGYGHIGRSVAHLARAFGMRVVATSHRAQETRALEIEGATPLVDLPAVPAAQQEGDVTEPIGNLHALLGQADAIVVCAALTSATEGLLDADAFAAMKEGALVVNIARGKIIDEEALVTALRLGRLGGAGLDVTADEPLPADSPLWEMPGVIITPHISGMSEHYVERAVNVFLDNLDHLRRGTPVPTAVDRARGY